MTHSPKVEIINHLPCTAYPDQIGGVVQEPRGVIMQGDLINDGAVAEKYAIQWANFVSDFGVNGEGKCRFPVFEGVGNHDVNPNLYVFNKVKERNLIRRRLGYISHISSNGYHYSWDWDGVHFVNVNLFPGNVWEGEADAYGRVHAPLYARDFLEEDLKKNVGNSGRPVVVVQHFRPVDENWWTYSAADRFHKVIQDYNILAIIVGHQGGGVNNIWRGMNWISSNGALLVGRIKGNEFVVLERSAKAWGQSMKKTIFHTYGDSGLPAVVNNGTWATDLTATGATLSAKLVYEASAPTEVTVYWGTTDGGNRAESWPYSKRMGVLKAGETGSVAVDGLKPWTSYYYRVAAINRKGTAWADASIPFGTAGLLPAGWQTAPVGHEQRPGGGAMFEDGVFTVRGSGRDIAERSEAIDNFQFAYGMLEGNGEIRARIATMDLNSREPKVGVMIRETPAAPAKNVALLFNPRTGLRLSWRDREAGRSVWSTDASLKDMPCWVRLVRRGSTITGYVSADGTQWKQAGKSVTVDMKDELCVGLAVTAGNRDGSNLHTSAFEHVEIAQE